LSPEEIAYSYDVCPAFDEYIIALCMLTGIMTILCYFQKCSSTSVNVVKQLQTVAKDGIHIDILETEVCLHVELKHGEGINY